MRSRQAAALDLTGEEIASSNSTLNTLLGGKQKSWMTGPGGSVKPTPRDQKRQRSSVSILPSPAPSGEPNPVLPSPQEHVQLEANRMENRFPQPDGPHQSAPQPTTSPSTGDNLQRPPWQAPFGDSRAPAQLFEAQQANSPREQTDAQTFEIIPSLRSQAELILDHISRFGGWDALSAGIEKPRFQLLLEACTNDDYFFVVLHQLYCIWTVDPDMLVNLNVMFQDPVFTAQVFHRVVQIIRPNDGVSRVHLEFFTKFPSPLQDLTAQPGHYRQVLATVTISLFKLLASKNEFFNICKQRGWPPLVNELVNGIGFISPLLQALFFTASRRYMGHADDDIKGHLMETIFQRNRDGYRALMARYHTSSPPSKKDFKDLDIWLVQSYMAINDGQGDAALHIPPPAQSFANGSNQNLMDAPRHPVSQGPVAQQQSYPAVTLLHQSPVNAHQSSASQSPAVQQFPFQVGDLLQTTDRDGRFHLPNHQSKRASQPRLVANNTPTAPQANLDGQNAMAPRASFAAINTPTVPQAYSDSQNATAPQANLVANNTPTAPQANSDGQNAMAPQANLVANNTPTTLQPYSNGQNAMAPQAYLAANSPPAAPQPYLNGQSAMVAQASHALFANQFTDYPVNPSRYPQQQVANNATYPSVPFGPINDYNSNQYGGFMSNNYPSGVTTSQAQPNLYHQQQQAHIVPRQDNLPQAPNRTNQQGAQQIVPRQRNGAAAKGRNVQKPRKATKKSTAVTQGSVSGAPPPSAPTPSAVVNRTNGRQNHNPRIEPSNVVPPQGHSTPVHPPNPEINAAHQSYLRSPYLVPHDTLPEPAGESRGGRYYQAVKEFALGPSMLSRHLTLSVFEFNVPDANFARIAKDTTVNAGSPAAREVHPGTLQYRMRCILAKHDDGKKAVDCAIADTVWPTSIFMEFNGVSMDVRRKLLHGKDLPIDITHFMLQNIRNQVKVSIPRPRKSRNDLDYIFVVEVVEVLQHQQILDMCKQKQRIPAHVTIDNIKQSLSGSLADDDISMVAEDLTINLADPFMARIFDIPVRGSSCLHRECFDLETFLLTRNSKPKLPYQISMVDVWKCPLCSKDARPYSLRVDEFLVSVRQSLAEQNILHTKTIIVAADGSWKPKPGELSAKRSASHAGLGDPYVIEDDLELKSPTNKLKKMEIIVLDDD